MGTGIKTDTDWAGPRIFLGRENREYIKDTIPAIHRTGAVRISIDRIIFPFGSDKTLTALAKPRTLPDTIFFLRERLEDSARSIGMLPRK